MFNLGFIIVHWLNYCMCQCMCMCVSVCVCVLVCLPCLSFFLPPWHTCVSLANLLPGAIARPW